MSLDFKVFLSIVCLLSLGITQAHAVFSKEECKGFDYTDRFGPVRDQGGHGYCWAFQTAALFEERLCKKDKKMCGKSVSPLDVSRCTWSLGQKNEGIVAGHLAAKCISALNEGGACLEESSPYSSLTSLGCSLWDLVKGGGTKCNNKKLADLYTRWKQAQKTFHCDEDGKSKYSWAQKAIDGYLETLIETLRKTLPEQALLGKDLQAIFRHSVDRSHFLKSILISQTCEENRHQAHGSVKSEWAGNNVSQAEKQKVLDLVKEGLNKGSSVGLNLNLGKTSLKNRFKYGKNYGHAIVVNGMRFNEATNQCEFHLRNSWGEGANFNGWYPVEKLKNAVTEGYYIEDY